MKVSIRIHDEIERDKRAIYYDDEISHHINEQDLQTLLRDTILSSWKSDPRDGTDIGVRLYGLLNGSGGRLDEVLGAFTHGW
jgi:hypothetical protein